MMHFLRVFKHSLCYTAYHFTSPWWLVNNLIPTWLILPVWIWAVVTFMNWLVA